MNAERTKPPDLDAIRARADKAEETLRQEQAAITAKAIHWRKERTALLAEIERLRETLRYMADYNMTGTEQTLHIDFQGKARAALAAQPEAHRTNKPSECAREAEA